MLTFKFNIHWNLNLLLKNKVVIFVFVLIKLNLLVLLSNHFYLWFNIINTILEIFLRNHLNNFRTIEWVDLGQLSTFTLHLSCFFIDILSLTYNLEALIFVKHYFILIISWFIEIDAWLSLIQVHSHWHKLREI